MSSPLDLLYKTLTNPESIRSMPISGMASQPRQGYAGEGEGEGDQNIIIIGDDESYTGILAPWIAGIAMFLKIVIWIFTFIALFMAYKTNDKTVNLLLAYYNPIAYIILSLVFRRKK